MLAATVEEFHRGKYRMLLVSGLSDDPQTESVPSSDAVRVCAQLEQLGMSQHHLVPCPAPFARWLRTSKTAKAVRRKVDELQLSPRGINVITAGPHARETWVAYEHMFGSTVPVGIISIPKTSYPANRWWMTRNGLLWVTKDFLAWVKEVLLGERADKPLAKPA